MVFCKHDRPNSWFRTDLLQILKDALLLLRIDDRCCIFFTGLWSSVAAQKGVETAVTCFDGALIFANPGGSLRGHPFTMK